MCLLVFIILCILAGYFLRHRVAINILSGDYFFHSIFGEKKNKNQPNIYPT